MDKKIIYRILREGLMLGYKKFPDRYFDSYTSEEFPKGEINEHPLWYKREYDQNGNETYYEDSYGYWLKREYDAAGNQIYYEDSNGEWEKYEYDEYKNIIYSEDSDGEWHKYKYDNNGKIIYNENSDGYWEKWEYDENGNEIYYENSDGQIDDFRTRIQEGLMLSYKKRDIKYFDYNTDKEFPYEEIDQHPEWYKEEYNSDGNRIYYEDCDGWWGRWEYDANGWLIYYENSDGVIVDDRDQIQEGLMLGYKKFPDRYFDSLTRIEFPKSEINKHIRWYKKEYDNNGMLIYKENYKGFWERYKYDDNYNLTFIEDSDGYWEKWEYDAVGEVIGFTNGYRVIRDNMGQINEGLMLPYKKYQNYLSGIANVLINQDWDTRYDAAQQRENRFNIKKALVEIFKDPNVMVRVADLYEWSDGNNGFISFNNLNHYITDIGFKSFADDPMLFFDMDKLKQHILYVYASGASGNFRRGERYRDYKYNPNDDFDW